MNKEQIKNELKVDFIGGEELTEAEKVLLHNYLAKKKKTKSTSRKKHAEGEKLK